MEVNKMGYDELIKLAKNIKEGETLFHPSYLAYQDLKEIYNNSGGSHSAYFLRDTRKVIDKYRSGYYKGTINDFDTTYVEDFRKEVHKRYERMLYLKRIYRTVSDISISFNVLSGSNIEFHIRYYLKKQIEDDIGL